MYISTDTCIAVIFINTMCSISTCLKLAGCEVLRCEEVIPYSSKPGEPSQPLGGQRLTKSPPTHQPKTPASYLFFSPPQIAFQASYCGGAKGSADYLLNPVNPSSHQSGMIHALIVFARCLN